MAEWLYTCLRISFLASVMILAVLIARPLLRKAPRNITCLLWLLVAVRLLLPFELKSPVSLQPLPVSEPASVTEQVTQWTPMQSERPVDLQPLPEQPDVEHPELNIGIETRRRWEPETLAVTIWLAGGTCLMLYAVISLLILQRRVCDAVRCADGTWECDHISTAFLLGYWKPRIYLPVGLNHQDRELIVAHERAHQSRGDQWWKLLGLVCLSLHWFNPLVWLSFWLMCRDIEAACDEKVVGKLDLSQRKDYSMALLNSGKRQAGFLSYPVAFGEVNLKHRIKTVLSYRKPGFWVTLAAVVLAVVIAVCFMTNPGQQKHEPAGGQPPVLEDVQPEIISKPTEPMTEPTEVTSAPTELTTTPTEPSTEPTEATTTPTEPKPTEPKPTEPKPTEPKPVEPRPTEPKPTEPKPTEPQPTEPPATAPTEPEATEPPNTVPTQPPVTEPPASAPEQGTIGGKYGDSMTWEYREDTQHLTLRGSGEMESGTTPPWEAYKSRISTLTIGEGISTIDYRAFKGYTGLHSVSIPGSVTRIGSEAFDGCTYLRTVQLHEGLQKIGSCAFRSTGIRSIQIPKTVIRIESNAFSNCGSGLRITFTGNAPIFEENVFYGTSATVYYPELNGSWQRIMSRCGDGITWVQICNNHSYVSGVCERCGAKKGM